MKNIAKTLVLFLILILGAGCSQTPANRVYSNSSPAVINEQYVSVNYSEATDGQHASADTFFRTEDESSIIKLTSIADYRFCTPIQLYENADLVVIGSFTKNNGAFVEEYGRIMTNAEVSVERTIKGELKGNAISLVLYGGSVPFLDYFNSFDEGSQKKMGIEISSIKSSDLVQSYHGEYQAYPVIGRQYLIFLNKMGDEDKYFLGSDAYAMLEIKDETYCNRDTLEWENIADLVKE